MGQLLLRLRHLFYIHLRIPYPQTSPRLQLHPAPLDFKAEYVRETTTAGMIIASLKNAICLFSLELTKMLLADLSLHRYTTAAGGRH